MKKFKRRDDWWSTLKLPNSLDHYVYSFKTKTIQNQTNNNEGKGWRRTLGCIIV